MTYSATGGVLPVANRAAGEIIANCDGQYIRYAGDKVRHTVLVLQTGGSRVSTLKLGNSLRVARAEKRLSQEDLAKLAGVTRQTISSIENGLYCPSALLAFVLANKLGKPVTDLFFIVL